MKVATARTSETALYAMADVSTLPDRLREIRRTIREEYLQSHDKPWILGFSGGKDSTLLLQVVIESILTISPDQRTRSVYVLSNDTLVESPVYQSQVVKTLALISEGVSALGLPIEVVQTHPEEDWTFWVNLLGRGYPAPNRNFRWCTDRMKIRPTTRFIREKASASGEVILLLGVRKAESIARAKRLEGYEAKATEGRLSPHNDVKGCLIFRPIIELTNDDVWHILLNVRAPWGGNHRELVTLYRNAQGGECPFVMSEADSPSCGSTSARFGCWTCTVVDKDGSLTGLIDAGFEYLEPLSAFRERIKAVSESPEHRSKVRRNGQPGLGPLTLEARRMLLDELVAMQAQTGLDLITDHEVRLIKDWWGRDETTAVLRDMDRLNQLAAPRSEIP
ncbi:DNA phosphorothioation system sulfurtransferase DndC [Aquisphaera insulae]|uniref:DNA phosphorothioation system sulfurtransferase DndC n=1 Tax=Aquisphaera insulae TaxID=2712864 RepID=UPI0013ECBFD0|nr:DNA phosphorothioation system sulfurtransferase DndC [Aquisphaera insulae]